MNLKNATSYLFLAVLAVGCGSQAVSPPETATVPGGKAKSQADSVAEHPQEEDAPLLQKVSAKHLPNPYRVTPTIISGGLPEGEEAFQELEELGIKTVISVDGMRPDVELARKHGMKYVHLPHGYNGVPVERGHELAKAVVEFPKPIYIHCHHGKHRSPTATAVACVEAGLIPASSAESILKTAGTNESYKGLYNSARQAQRQDSTFLKELKVEFQEAVNVTPLAQSMVALDMTFDRLTGEFISPAPGKR